MSGDAPTPAAVAPGLPGASSPTVSQIAGRTDLPGPEALTLVVALDGPAGSGKSSVARAVAARLGWRFVDTGASYRAATLAVLAAGLDPGDAPAVLEVVRSARIQLVTDPRKPLVLLDGRDVTTDVRSAEVTANVSAVSAVPAVRQLLIALQRHAMGPAGAVVEGRDIATVVAPLAELKVYLDARPEVRARRRTGELSVGEPPAAGLQAEVAKALSRRDALDSNTNLLEVSDGAVHLDTSDLTLDQVVEEIVRLVRAAVGAGS